MRKPKYGLLEKLYYFKHGQIQVFNVDAITIAREGIPPFDDPPYHNQIFYIDESGFAAPENLCFLDAEDALNEEILRLEKQIKNL